MDFNLKLNFRNSPLWFCFWSISCIYKVVLKCRELLYKYKLITRYKSNRIVISIGNITVGGTGKSPIVSALLSFLEKKELNLAVLTRGYGRNPKTDRINLNQVSRKHYNVTECGDEPWMLSLNHPNSSFFISANRVESAKLAQRNADVIVMDDGMQHIRLKRNLDICLVDKVTGFGNGHLLPLGPLREPLANINRADVIIITKTNLDSNVVIEESIKAVLKRNTPIFKAKYQSLFLFSEHSNVKQPIENLSGKRCILISGIGNPVGFENTVKSAKGEVVRHFKYPDHYQFNNQTIADIESEISIDQFDFILTTEKDFVKLNHLNKKISNLHYVKMEMVIEKGFYNYIENYLLDVKKLQTK